MNDLLEMSVADKAARAEALDNGESFIVQAPAGSGKTDLLTRRYLKLLATVDEPEEILAITFTRAATAEMRSRILDDLAAAEKNQALDDERIALARAALKHAKQRGWRLLEQPERLDIQTIDSLCLRLAHEQPLLARLGGRLQPTEHATSLYAEAARRTLGVMGSAGPELNDALSGLLQLRDNSLVDCERLIADMLGKRDQWAHAFLLSGEIDWDEVRMRLERPFKRAIRRTLTDAHRLMAAMPTLTQQLFELADYACGNQPEIGIALLQTLRDIPAPDEGLLAHWRCLCNLLLIGEKSPDSQNWRKQLNKTHGFPPGAARMKDRMKEIIGRLAGIPGLLSLLCDIRNLPPCNYDDSQWQTLRRIFTVLRHAVAELRVLFAEQNTVDFIEIGMAAQQVLREPTDRALGVSERIRHLLVDEFQDTSRRQHQLVSMLVRAWDQGDRHTCFLVGDPMQSIYMFRQAEVELFSQARQHGIVSEDHQLALKPLQLSKNFRSHAGLTEPLNDYFEQVFASTAKPGAAAVPFSPSFAERNGPPSISVHADFVLSPSLGGNGQPDARAARQREAAEALKIIKAQLPQIARAETAGEEYRVAVLVRAKQHFADLIPLLRQAGIPFRGVELETLGERQEILDLLSLARALLHPMDRIAWLSVLRAPWCGLTLKDLYVLCGRDARALQRTSLSELVAMHGHLLSDDGRMRLERTHRILEQAQAARYQQAQSFSSWIERTWRTLGGPQCIDAAALANTQVFFQMLDSLGADGVDSALDAELRRLFAQPDPSASERCGVQLMTIHKAKGLGFDVVIVPALDRKPRGDSQPLVCSLERTLPGDSNLDEMLVAPIGSKGGTSHPLYKWVQAQKKLREDEERKRLFYVACTRARNELHLLGTATTGKAGLRPGDANSLLATAWPALAPAFAEQQPAESAAPYNVIEFPQPGVLAELAASLESTPKLMLRRLPLDAPPPTAERNVAASDKFSASPKGITRYERPEGSRHVRIIGTVIHALLERLSHNSTGDAPPLRDQARAMLRAFAYQGDALDQAIAEAVQAAEAALSDPVGRWLLGPHTDAQSEASWTGWIDGRLRTLRADRIFRAGQESLSEGQECFWIVDYKTTARVEPGLEAFLQAQRVQYEPQLAAYGRILRTIHGESTALRLALYYPRLDRFDDWAG